MASTATATMNYDANGNTIQKSEGSNFWRYTWDYENRLVKASTRKQNVRYKYDALGRRVERNFDYGKERTKYTHDGLDVLADDDFGTLTKYLDGPGIDNKLRTQTGSNVNYFLTDHLGSTNGLTDSSGNLNSSANYDSFGNRTGNLASRYQFTGREYDNFTGQYFYRARFYDSALGRFTSEDPIGFRGGDVNIYSYVSNKPLLHVDPTGLDMCGVVVGGSGWGGAVVGGGGTAGTLVGYGSDGLGTASSYGSFAGPGRTPADTSRNSGWGIGGGGGVGGGVFYSNADKWEDYGGDFETTIFGAGPFGSVQVDCSPCDRKGTWVIQAYPGPLGKGQSYGPAHFRTHTPPASTGRFMDEVYRFGGTIEGGIRSLYGY